MKLIEANHIELEGSLSKIYMKVEIDGTIVDGITYWDNDGNYIDFDDNLRPYSEGFVSKIYDDPGSARIMNSVLEIGHNEWIAMTS